MTSPYRWLIVISKLEIKAINSAAHGLVYVHEEFSREMTSEVGSEDETHARLLTSARCSATMKILDDVS